MHSYSRCRMVESVFRVMFLYCPRCGAPMRLVNNTWVCRVCGYKAPATSVAGGRKPIPA